MSAIVALLAPYAAKLAAGAGVAILAILAALGLRKSGADAAKSDAARKDAEHADTIRQAGADARARADASPADRLRNDDGWRRD